MVSSTDFDMRFEEDTIVWWIPAYGVVMVSPRKKGGAGLHGAASPVGTPHIPNKATDDQADAILGVLQGLS